MFLDLRRNHLYYFDSYGKPIHSNMKKFGNTIVEQGKSCDCEIDFIKLKKVHQKKVQSVEFIVFILLLHS